MLRMVAIALSILTVGSAITITEASVLGRPMVVAPGVSVRSICVPIPGQGVCVIENGSGGEPFSFPITGVGLPGAQHDATGAWYFLDTPLYTCSGTAVRDLRVFRVKPDDSSELVLEISGCGGSVSQLYATGLTVDAVNGTALLVAGGSTEPEELIEISGLPTLLDIIPTFQPAAGTLSWTTPKHPEALPAADRFMVFAGDVPSAGNISVPIPFDCNVPAAGNPQPGDYLSILDPLADPAVGEASYVIIGVEHQMEQRFGRQQIGGVLAGRAPGTFVGCS